MSALFIGVGIALVLIVVWLRVRRRWVEPWHELDELVNAIVVKKAPRKFLMTANERANTLGLALEKLAE
nr:hypothetical protein [Verrucomicrobiota bacterium]